VERTLLDNKWLYVNGEMSYKRIILCNKIIELKDMYIFIQKDNAGGKMK
jgi:hypothetical protein